MLQTTFHANLRHISRVENMVDVTLAIPRKYCLHKRINMNRDLISYYRQRANEYEKVYSKPERQSELLFIEQNLQDIFRNKSVIEIACGTGYWTEKISKSAASIVASDINESVIEIAKSKHYSPASVNFQIADLFQFNETNKYESLFGGFIWSHINLPDLNRFIKCTNRLVESGGMVVFIDNNYVEGSSQPITETDDIGNTFQMRTLEDGTTHRVLKNFPKEEQIQQALGTVASEINFVGMQYYWILKYKAL
jgi:2-polyprenyl-3-methyl-5-hydroxy-6-metoxy-1,4-benzoquinol methylase